MAVFLTQNSPGLRTSPVKRGYWVVRRLLGERIPPPPPDVPELPEDESKLGERTLRQTLAMHREHTACAGCHDDTQKASSALPAPFSLGSERITDYRIHGAAAMGGRFSVGYAQLHRFVRRPGLESDYCSRLVSLMDEI